MEKIDSEFRRMIRNHSGYKRFFAVKKRIFPIFKCLDSFPSFGSLVDLGCGNGLFAALAGVRHRNLRIIAFDNDSRKIDLAKEVFSPLNNIRFVKNDIMNLKYPFSLNYSLIDVLYLIPYHHQERIIAQIAHLLPREGSLVIKEMDKKPRYKFLFNLIQETAAVKWFHLTLGSRFYFRSQDEWRKILNKNGFKNILIERMDKGYLYPHILIKALKG